MADKEVRILMVRSEQDLSASARVTLERLHPGATFVPVEPRTAAELREQVDPEKDAVFLRMTALPEDCLRDGVACYFVDEKTDELRKLTGIILQWDHVVLPPE